MTPQEQLKELKQEAEKFNNTAIRINADIENAGEQLARLKAQALSEFGTSDLSELKDKLQQLNVQNEAIIDKAKKEVERLRTETQEKSALIQKIKNGA